MLFVNPDPGLLSGMGAACCFALLSCRCCCLVLAAMLVPSTRILLPRLSSIVASACMSPVRIHIITSSAEPRTSSSIGAPGVQTSTRVISVFWRTRCIVHADEHPVCHHIWRSRFSAYRVYRSFDAN